MVKQMKWVLAMIALVCATAPRAEAISITLRPDAALTGQPGSTIGWGYEIVNDSAFWLLFDNINASLDDPSEGDVATSIFDLPIVDPGATVLLDYDAVNALGLLQLSLSASLPLGTLVTGEAFGSYQIYSDADLTVFEGSEEWVTEFAATAVPEPGSFLLLGGGIAALVVARRRRKL